MNLYWVTTEDHDEDWFIVASSEDQAAALHEQMEGYHSGDATAEEILEIPEHVEAEVDPEAEDGVGWPTEQLLLAVGAKFLHKDETRVVEIEGRTFCEGMLDALINELNDDLLEQRGDGRPNKTIKPTRMQ